MIDCAAQTERVVASYGLPRVSALCTVASVVFTLSMSVATTGWAKQSEAQIAAYIEQLDASDDKKRSQAIAALVAIGPSAVPQLIGAFRHLRFKFDGVEVLNEIGPLAVDALRQALRDPDENIRMGAAEGLEGLGSYAEAAVPNLVEALKDKKQGVRRAAAMALMRVVGPGADAGVNEIAAALKDPDDTVRSAAAEALGKIGPATSVPIDALIEALKEDDVSGVRMNAARSLSDLG